MGEKLTMFMAITNMVTHSFPPSRLVVPLGIATLSLLVVTAGTGLFMRKMPKRLFKWHKRLAFTTVIFGACHGLIVIFFY